MRNREKMSVEKHGINTISKVKSQLSATTITIDGNLPRTKIYWTKVSLSISVQMLNYFY